ncbi:hypothetical protein EDI_037900 [Entamoeba dispar SAW760]|uniref:Uncharacterized protein n=1 Tax=Entamoeba dispar (strain ATCC PRA-260 / SAW760) TaxID=370354 RepID=B0ERJ2_ENTDS|nr:uncharacterized protein EDI_037900 [Entamoeba dispar SAW760]EDR22850.1 hypothetical protein EDI_037900 [Entamoeba dispar SAW760]|eukprot:EDR22850.1 hypothetical protein EDI_037900 [Entamoeba dispar SAW760]
MIIKKKEIQLLTLLYYSKKLQIKSLILSDEKSIKEVSNTFYLIKIYNLFCSFIIDIYFSSKVNLIRVTQLYFDFSSFTQLQEIQIYSKYSINYSTSLTILRDCFYLYITSFLFHKNITIIQNDMI